MDKILYFVLVMSLALLACKSDTTNQSTEQTQTVATGRDTTITFDNTEIGKLPTGWSAETSVWSIGNENSNAALKMNRNVGKDFNIAVLKSNYFQNIEIEARIKALEGEEDQGGGLVWRYIDSRNYYIIRANPLENNIRLYKVVNGSRKQMQSENITVQTGEWFTIKVIVQNEKVDCFLNGRKVFSDSDDTFSKPGRVGFWSKADAVSLFDDLKISALK